MIREHGREIEFLEDYRKRINPELMNRLLYRSVPVLEHTKWAITKVDFGFCESVLPLNQETTNQHGTHQAALISLSADYTGGMALTTVLTGVPLSGIHQCQPDEAASLWLASMNVKYLKPSTGHLTARCEIDDKSINRIRDRYFSEKRVLVALPITFVSNGNVVAEAELKYFAQPTIQLLSPGKNRSALFTQKLKASARMIAGVRAGKAEASHIRVDCAHAETAAGPHGMLLADRLQQALPQLTNMVHSRTHHIDRTFENMASARQVVFLGAGLDMRVFRFAQRDPAIEFFEVDLPEMLEERERVIAGIDSKSSVIRYSIAADFRRDDIAAKILSTTPFNPELPTLFVYEGCSMYFDRDENRKIIANVWQLGKNRDSKFWSDFVTTAVVDGITNRPEIEAFVDQMDKLGESFVFGTDQPAEFLRTCGCRKTRAITCRNHMQSPGPIYDVYQFCVGGNC